MEFRDKQQALLNALFRSRVSQVVSLSFYVLFCLLVTLYAIKSPYYNADLSGYLGVVYSYQTDDPEELHHRTFHALKTAVPEHRFIRLAGLADDSSPATTAAYREPEAFNQKLPFYKVRVVYTACIFLLMEIGIDPVFASHALSAISALAMLLLFAFMFPGYPSAVYWFALVPITLSTGASELGRFSSPDALGALLWTLVFFLAIRKVKAAFYLLPFLVLVRTDYVLLSALFCLAFVLTNREFRFHACVSFVLSFVFYFSLQANWGYSWMQQMHYHYFLYDIKSAYIADADIEFGIRQYLELQKGALSRSIVTTDNLLWSYFVFTAACTVLMYSVFTSKNSKACAILTTGGIIILAGLLYVLGHIVVIPRLDPRYFTTLYLFSPCLLIYLLDKLDARREAIFK